jgi:hypothetical protein
MYDAQGRPSQGEVFGDDIAHVQATDTGEIWVGYFDEGVYGNYGWGSSRLPIGRRWTRPLLSDLHPDITSDFNSRHQTAQGGL